MFSLVSPLRPTRPTPAFRPGGTPTNGAPTWTGGGLGQLTWRRWGGRSWRWWTTAGWRSTCAASPPGWGRDGILPRPDSWQPGVLIGEQIGESGAAAGVRLFSWNNNRTTSSRYSPTEPPSPSHLLREQSDCSQDEGRAADREFSLSSKWGAVKVLSVSW